MGTAKLLTFCFNQSKWVQAGFAPVAGGRQQRAVSSTAQFCTEASIFTTDPAERRGSRDKRRISLAVASELVLVEDYSERPQRYCQVTGLM